MGVNGFLQKGWKLLPCIHDWPLILGMNGVGMNFVYITLLIETKENGLSHCWIELGSTIIEVIKFVMFLAETKS